MKNFWSYAFAACFCFTLLLVTMAIKTDVQALLQERKDMFQARMQLEENARVLKAEYAYLSNPQRLTNYAQKWGMVEMQSVQLATMDQIYNQPVQVAYNQP